VKVGSKKPSGMKAVRSGMSLSRRIQRAMFITATNVL
jgi:hypothetical protein